jgi:hypothetical protein
LKQAAELTKEDEKWQKVSMSEAPGMENLDIRVHADYCMNTKNADTTTLSKFFSFVSKFMMELGGALPLIVKNEFSDGRWKAEIERGVQHPLDEDSLRNLLGFMKGVPIYLVGDHQDGKHVEKTCEGNMTLTLDPSDFDDSSHRPNLKGARLMIFVDGLEKVACAVDVCSPESSQRADIGHAEIMLGRTRHFIHEICNGLRLVTAIPKFHDTLQWIRNDANDWCITLEDAVTMIGTPPKSSEIQMGVKESSDLPADAGLTWEHSITEGKAIFEGDFKLISALKRENSSALDVVPKRLSAKDVFHTIENPGNLIRISRGMADLVFSKKDPSGTRAAAAACYVSHSETMIPFQDHCQSSVAWRAYQVQMSSASNTGRGGFAGLTGP